MKVIKYDRLANAYFHVLLPQQINFDLYFYAEKTVKSMLFPLTGT